MAESIRAMLAQRRQVASQNRILLGKDEHASLSGQAALTIVGVVVGAVVGLAVLAALLPTFFSSLKSVGQVFTASTTSTGSTTADALLPTFGLLIAFSGLFAIVGLAILVVSYTKKKNA